MHIAYTVKLSSGMDASVEIEVPEIMRHFGDLVVRKYMPKEVRQLNRAHRVLHWVLRSQSIETLPLP